MKTRWYDDFSPGEIFISPGKTITESEIIDWGFKYDPQPFHISTVDAQKHMYGGLIASGWMLATYGFRLFMAINPFSGSSLGSPGCDELRWQQPVRPNDTIRTYTTITGMRTSDSKPDRGIINLEWDIKNQNELTVMSLKSIQLVARNPEN